MELIKPKVIIGKYVECNNFYSNPEIINIDFIKKLKYHINFITICPEIEQKLEIPRETILTTKEQKYFASLCQSNTNQLLQNKINKYLYEFLNKLIIIDGFILKFKSLRNEISSTKKNYNIKINNASNGGIEDFNKNIINFFPFHPKQKEIFFNNQSNREHFYTSIFTLADFRSVNSFNNLYSFQARHKLLFMTYNQTKMRALGKIAANYDGLEFNEVILDYYINLLQMFSNKPSHVSHINTQMHAFGYYSKGLTKEEKNNFFQLLFEYRNKLISINKINNLIEYWNKIYDNEYLSKQSYFKPYPNTLI